MGVVYARAILPRRPFPANRRKVQAELVRAAKEIGELAVKYYEEIVAEWSEENKPQFSYWVQVEVPNFIKVGVTARGPKAKILKIVSKGTPKRTIVPKKPGGVLVFRTDYKPKTTPRGTYKGPGKATGEKVFVKKVTKHKIRARRFERTVARWLRQRKDVGKIMKNAMARAKRAL